MKALSIVALLFMTSINVHAKEIYFRKEKILLGENKITIEVADSDPKRQYGLMNRKFLPENQGMLFVFTEEKPLSFWMKDTLISLDIGFFDKNKKLIDIQSMVPASELELRPKLYQSKSPAQYALEMPMNWFGRHKIKVGTSFKNIKN